MAKLVLADLVNLQNEPTAVGTINSNSALIEAALENTLSRDGTSPNTMGATLDMNSNHIINLPPANSLLEPLRYKDLLDFTGGEFTNLFQLDVHGEFAEKNTVAATADLVRFYDGSASHPVTSKDPTFSISRYDTVNITGGEITSTPLYIDYKSYATSSSSGLAPTTGALIHVEQHGVSDVLGMGVEVQNHGGGSRFAYGYYANVWANAVDAAAYGQEISVFNDAANTSYSTGSTPYHVGAVYYAGGNYLNTVGVYFDRSPAAGATRKWDVGIAFRPDAINNVSIWDDSSSTHILYATAAHFHGINLASATFSGNSFSAPNFSVNGTNGVVAAGGFISTVSNSFLEIGNTGASNTPFVDFHSSGNSVDYDSRIIASGGTGVTGNGTLTVTAATFALPAVTTINGIQAVSISANQTLTNKTMSGSSNTFTNIPVSTAISGLGANVATALAVAVGTDGAFVVKAGALGSPSSVGTMPAFTLGGTISGGGNQINNVIIGNSTPLAGTFTTVSVTATTTSTTTTTGALKVSGGTGIAENLNVGGWTAVSGELATLSTSASTTTGTGALRSSGGLGVAGAGNFGSYVNVPGTSGYKLNGVTVLDVGSVNYTRILDPSGAQAFSVGNATSGFPYLFFDRDETWFRLAGPGSVLAKFKSAGLEVLTSTASTTSSSGSLTTAGGIGCAGDINVAGYLATAGNVSASGQATSLTGTGYRTGAGGTVTQSTSKATGVTLNKTCGQITTPNDSLNANTTTSFTFTNSTIGSTDLLILDHVSGGTIGGYDLFAVCGSGSATVYIRNRTAGVLSEAIVIRFALIKAATS